MTPPALYRIVKYTTCADYDDRYLVAITRNGYTIASEETPPGHYGSHAALLLAVDFVRFVRRTYGANIQTELQREAAAHAQRIARVLGD